MSRVVLVTGVSRDIGARFARALAATATCEVIGLDLTPPRHDLDGVDFVRADIRGPLLHKLLLHRQVDTVVHLSIADPTEAMSGHRAQVKESNVLGTMQLMASCQLAPSIDKLILMGSSAVYGSGPLDPARFAEDSQVHTGNRTSFGRDAAEVEEYVRGFARRRREVCVTLLRMAPAMGAGVDTALTRALALPVVPKALGFDARLQFLHPVDAVNALIAVTERDLPGTFNVAADDVVPLSQALRILGRPAVDLAPAIAPLVLGAARTVGLAKVPTDQFRTLTHGRVIDTDRFTGATGLHPHYTSRRAIEEFAAFARPGILSAHRIDAVLDSAARMLAPDREGAR